MLSVQIRVLLNAIARRIWGKYIMREHITTIKARALLSLFDNKRGQKRQGRKDISQGIPNFQLYYLFLTLQFHQHNLFIILFSDLA